MSATMTKAALLRALKQLTATPAKKAAKRKTNPAKRIGTKKPLRASQVTGKPPTKRLTRRRKANKVEGYFPNPAAVRKAYGASKPPARKRKASPSAYIIEIFDATGEWTEIARAWSQANAKTLAEGYADRTQRKVRVMY